MSEQDGLRALAERLSHERRASIAVHEHPDLDALGSAVGMLDLFSQSGVEARLHLDDEAALPQASFGPEPAQVVAGPPAPGATLYALDSGSLPRLAVDLGQWTGPIVNVDHHHDNTRFGTLNIVLPDASSVSEIICRLAAELGLRPAPRAAAALYAGISFDSGHFRHASTSPVTLRCAAALLEAGADPTAIFAELYERRSLPDLRLWARVIGRAVGIAGGRAIVALMLRADLDACGAGEDAEDGIVETLRSARGVEVAALVKEQRGGTRTRVSLRSSGWDVSAFASEHGGGGHRQAAGFSSDDAPEEVARWLSSALDERLSTASS